MREKCYLLRFFDNKPTILGVYDLEGNLIKENNEFKKFINNTNFLMNEYVLKNLNEILENLKEKTYYINDLKIKGVWYKYIFSILNDSDKIILQIFKVEEEKECINKKFLINEKQGMVITNTNGTILSTNQYFLEITGYEETEVVGKSSNILSSGIHNEDFYKVLWLKLKYSGQWEGEIWNKRKNGEIYPEWLYIEEFVDEESGEIRYIGIFSDISNIKSNEKKLEFYANYDYLTGLLNRFHFEKILEKKIENLKNNRNENVFSLLFIDIDNFKQINDTSGHEIGDEILKRIAKNLRKILRKEDIIARVGGDEFNVILNNVNTEKEIISICKKINKEIKQPIIIDEEIYYISASIGVAIYPKHGTSAKELIKNADSTMSEVKKKGKDNILIYNQKYTEKIMFNYNLQSDIKEAINKREFQIYYQPVINLENNKIEGAEALIRWFHPTRGFVPPDLFIPIAEKSNLIIEIGKLVVDMAFSDFQKELKENKDFILSINISSKEFFESGFVKNLKKKCQQYEVNPNQIELEITETYIMKNHKKAIKKFNKLKKAGFKLAIDDFGKGYSSLNYLKSFPVDKLKIDKSFVEGVINNKSDKTIVETIIKMAKIFHFKVQAEGVEKITQENELKNLNCDLAQGYFYKKPVCLEDFKRILSL